MMKLPIPQDWDGEAYQCITVYWPDSPAYRALLLGFLSYLTRGRTWDETSGNIRDVQAIAWGIWDKNYPLIACVGQGGPSGAVPAAVCGGAAVCDGEDECMPSCIMDIKIENGVLYVMYSGCCEWVAVGSIASLPVDIGDNPFTPPGEEPPVYYACGKAKALTDALYAVADSVWDRRLNAPWDFFKGVNADTGLQLSYNWLALAWSQALKMDLVWQPSLFDPEVRQWLQCKALDIFDSTGTPMSSAQYQRFRNLVFLMPFGNFIDNAFARAYFDQCLAAIGEGQARNLVQLGAVDNSASCDCPNLYGRTPPPFSEEEILLDIGAEAEQISLECDYGGQIFTAQVVPGVRIRGWGETTTNPNQECELGEFCAPEALELQAGDEIWMLPVAYSKGPTTSFKFECGMTLHREGGDTQWLMYIGDEYPCFPGAWSRIGVMSGDNADVTSVYGTFQWYADGEDIDLQFARLIARRPT